MAPVIWCLITVLLATQSGSQYLTTKPANTSGLCPGMLVNSLAALTKLKNCVVIVGNLRVVLLEQAMNNSFVNHTYESLREVTGFLLLYRIRGLHSLGILFPKLTRIRGNELLGNYALIVYDLPNLIEVGLYSLMKIDRGGVMIWGNPVTCFVDTINWKYIAPLYRHVIGPLSKDTDARCPTTCRCTMKIDTNYCWNMKMCQQFAENSDSKCNDQCIGCRKTNPNECFVCKNKTFNTTCLEMCPANTILLKDNDYCLTHQECESHLGWAWNQTCVTECPIGFKKAVQNGTATCETCPTCGVVCKDMRFTFLQDIKEAQNCVHVNGSLRIHVRASQAMEEMRKYLNKIEVVTGFIVIHTSHITSLDFFQSLKKIEGKELYANKYSLLIHKMGNLVSLFTPEVTKNLIVANGTIGAFNNPFLCLSKIEEIKDKFPVKPQEIDIPEGLNGYSGSCKEVDVNLEINVKNETSAIVTFTRLRDPDIQYTLLYVKLTSHNQAAVPESCSEHEWHSINVPMNKFKIHSVELNSLDPGTTYAICIESYSPKSNLLARSSIKKFTTFVYRPKPPFIFELEASSEGVVVIRWVNHINYNDHITHYKLDVSIIDMDQSDAMNQDHCNRPKHYDFSAESFRHAVVTAPPPGYGEPCESICGLLSTVTKGDLVEEDFDVCNGLDNDDCENEIIDSPGNTTMGEFVKTMELIIHSPESEFQVGGLAPYRDYRFRLRACKNINCSRSARSVVRTFPSETADLATITYLIANKNGEIYLEWQPPDVVNGIILAYYVQLYPYLKQPEIGNVLPQNWCVKSNISSIFLLSDMTKLQVRICTMSLGPLKCNDWVTIVPYDSLSLNWWWSGILVGFLISIFSMIAARYCKPRTKYNDDILLLDSTSFYRNESEPPRYLLSDFSPIYPMSLSETCF